MAKSLGLSQPTAGKIVDELLDMGVFEEVDGPAPAVKGKAVRIRAGRPARMLRLNQSKSHFLAIELGIEETRFAPAPAGVTGEDQWTTQVKTPDSAAQWQRELQATADSLIPKKFWGVLLSVPGLLYERTGKVLYSPNLHWTEEADLSALIGQVWKSPVILVQEEHALALGHQTADPEGEDFLLVDFGEGVGGAVMLGGKLHAHPLPISGELGHTPVPGNPRQCGCGALGCLETLSSTRGLLQSFATAHPSAPRSWAALVESIRPGDVPPWLAGTLDATASIIAGALNVLGLRRVVITGALNEMPPHILTYLSQAISKGALWARFGDIKVESAPRRRVAGLVAAGLDQLIMPIAEGERAQEVLLHISAPHG
jgi:predicted NBD/HSP70 family sugar kinase